MRPGEAFADKSRSLENLHHLQLMALLRELMSQHGRKETAEVLGIDPRTLDTCLERRALSRRVQGELERVLLSGGSSAAARQREELGDLNQKVEALEQQNTELKGRMEALEKEVRSSLKDGPEGDASGLIRRLDEGVQQVQGLARRVAGLEEGRTGGATPGARVAEKERRPVYNGPYRVGVVTKEPHPGEEASYGPGLPLVEEWRHLWRVREEGSKLTQAKGRERIMALEIAMIGEYELTLPPETSPLHPSVREGYLGWRRRALVDIQRERTKRELLRWLRRLLTLGLWWK